MPRIVYLVDETLEHPVLQSQSLSVVQRLLEAGMRIDILIANGASAGREEEIARTYLGGGPRVLVLSRRHRGPSALAKARRAMGRALARRRAAKFISEIEPADETLVLHARGSAMHLGGQLRAQFDRARLVVDVRGDAAAEARFHLAGEAGERRAAMVDRMDARVFSRADHVLCVSAALLAGIRARFAFACPATVIPCVADERRFFPDVERRLQGRKSLGLTSEPLLVYAGSIGQWHQFESTLDTFEGVARKNDQARFLVATRDAEEATKLVSARPGLRERTLVRHGGADEVARWMNAGDVGLLLREPHPLNRVACPTKFGEYVLSGLQVVVSEEIGDLAGWVRGLDLGACVRGADASKAASACTDLLSRPTSSDDRASRVQRAAPVLSMGARLQDWVETYRSTIARASV